MKAPVRLGLCTVMLLLSACAGAPPNPNPRAAEPLKLAPAVDLQRFMGRWYVVANIPYFAERGYVGSYVEYAVRDDGDIDDLYFGRKGGFSQPLEKKTLKDWVVQGSNNAEWRSSPFWPLSFSYLILYIDPDYRYALIGYPDRRWGWVFARSPDIEDPTYQQLLARLDSLGYDTSRFRRVPQKVEQLGLQGFQTP
ncbi:MAG: lipocalin family protein [Nevskia sp.]|nr:lipocalin family protein [Nevskia sp.]